MSEHKEEQQQDLAVSATPTTTIMNNIESLQIQASSNLQGGHILHLNVNGTNVVVEVPEGGVEEGDIFEAIPRHVLPKSCIDIIETTTADVCLVNDTSNNNNTTRRSQMQRNASRRMIIEITAPYYLPAKELFHIDVDGIPMIVTIPEGGIQAGESFTTVPRNAQQQQQQSSNNIPGNRTSATDSHETTVDTDAGLFSLQAPCDFPAGYQLIVDVGGGNNNEQPMFVTVPDGGVRAGQTFTARPQPMNTRNKANNNNNNNDNNNNNNNIGATTTTTTSTQQQQQQQQQQSQGSEPAVVSPGSIRIDAPCDFPGGYEFMVEVDGTDGPMIVTVPNGGVKAGESFMAVPKPMTQSNQQQQQQSKGYTNSTKTTNATTTTNTTTTTTTSMTTATSGYTDAGAFSSSSSEAIATGTATAATAGSAAAAAAAAGSAAQDTTTTIEVEAPCDLPGGTRFRFNMGVGSGGRITVIVPDGGVQAGETFYAIPHREEQEQQQEQTQTQQQQQQTQSSPPTSQQQQQQPTQEHQQQPDTAGGGGGGGLGDNDSFHSVPNQDDDDEEEEEDDDVPMMTLDVRQNTLGYITNVGSSSTTTATTTTNATNSRIDNIKTDDQEAIMMTSQDTTTTTTAMTQEETISTTTTASEKDVVPMMTLDVRQTTLGYITNINDDSAAKNNNNNNSTAVVVVEELQDQKHEHKQDALESNVQVEEEEEEDAVLPMMTLDVRQNTLGYITDLGANATTTSTNNNNISLGGGVTHVKVAEEDTTTSTLTTPTLPQQQQEHYVDDGGEMTTLNDEIPMMTLDVRQTTLGYVSNVGDGTTTTTSNNKNDNVVSSGGTSMIVHEGSVDGAVDRGDGRAAVVEETPEEEDTVPMMTLDVRQTTLGVIRGIGDDAAADAPVTSVNNSNQSSRNDRNIHVAAMEVSQEETPEDTVPMMTLDVRQTTLGVITGVGAANNSNADNGVSGGISARHQQQDGEEAPDETVPMLTLDVRQTTLGFITNVDAARNSNNNNNVSDGVTTQRQHTQNFAVIENDSLSETMEMTTLDVRQNTQGFVTNVGAKKNNNNNASKMTQIVAPCDLPGGAIVRTEVEGEGNVEFVVPDGGVLANQSFMALPRSSVKPPSGDAVHHTRSHSGQSGAGSAAAMTSSTTSAGGGAHDQRPVVQMTAPANLNAGTMLQVDVQGERMTVVVPPGGVAAGETFTAVPIPIQSPPAEDMDSAGIPSGPESSSGFQQTPGRPKRSGLNRGRSGRVTVDDGDEPVQQPGRSNGSRRASESSGVSGPNASDAPVLETPPELPQVILQSRTSAAPPPPLPSTEPHVEPPSEQSTEHHAAPPDATAMSASVSDMPPATGSDMHNGVEGSAGGQASTVGATSLVEIQAPYDLPGGTSFHIDVAGKSATITAPPGGVRAGQTFTAVPTFTTAVAAPEPSPMPPLVPTPAPTPVTTIASPPPPTQGCCTIL